MPASHGVKAAVFVGLSLLLAACQVQVKMRYRMTVEVSDGDKIITGSVVREDHWTEWQPHQDWIGMGLTHQVIGDAIVLPVQGRLLVVSLGGWFNSQGRDALSGCTGPAFDGEHRTCSWSDRTWSPIYNYSKAMGDSTFGAHPLSFAADLALTKNLRPLEITPDAAPILLTFDGEPALASVRVLDATKLDEVFGPGVSLRSIRVQRTREPVTRSVAQVLPFVKDPSSGGSCVYRPDLLPGGMRPTDQLVNPDLGACAEPKLFTG